MTDYLTVKDTVYETVIKKSRFISYVYNVLDSEDAESKLAVLRKKHYDATHVCYAYISDIVGNEARYSDDGEPSGTAGQPILEALKRSGVKKTLVAVVRYFGGTLLGAGGLVRAYSSSCSEGIAKAEKVKFLYRDLYECKFDFSTYRKISGALSKIGEVQGVEYTDAVSVKIAVEVGYDIKRRLDELCATSTSPVFISSQYVTEKNYE